MNIVCCESEIRPKSLQSGSGWHALKTSLMDLIAVIGAAIDTPAGEP